MYKKDVNQARYWKAQARSLLADYTAVEERKAVRIVLQNEYFVGLVPYWAMWPFEILNHYSFTDKVLETETFRVLKTLKV